MDQAHRVELKIDIHSQEPVERVEIVFNGKVVGNRASKTVRIRNRDGWRCVASARRARRSATPTAHRSIFPARGSSRCIAPTPSAGPTTSTSWPRRRTGDYRRARRTRRRRSHSVRRELDTAGGSNEVTHALPVAARRAPGGTRDRRHEGGHHAATLPLFVHGVKSKEEEHPPATASGYRIHTAPSREASASASPPPSTVQLSAARHQANAARRDRIDAHKIAPNARPSGILWSPTASGTVMRIATGATDCTDVMLQPSINACTAVAESSGAAKPCRTVVQAL